MSVLTVGTSLMIEYRVGLYVEVRRFGALFAARRERSSEGPWFDAWQSSKGNFTLRLGSLWIEMDYFPRCEGSGMLG
jgi:hypothetical protein